MDIWLLKPHNILWCLIMLSLYRLAWTGPSYRKQKATLKCNEYPSTGNGGFFYTMKLLLNLVLLAIVSLSLSSCGPKAFTKGDYDDVSRENLLNDRWSETDLHACWVEKGQHNQSGQARLHEDSRCWQDDLGSESRQSLGTPMEVGKRRFCRIMVDMNAGIGSG